MYNTATQYQGTFAYNTNSDINVMKNFSSSNHSNFGTWIQENTFNHILTLSLDLVPAHLTRFVQVHFVS